MSMTEAQLQAFRQGAPFHELVNGGRAYGMLRNVEPDLEETMTDLMDLDEKDLTISGLRLLLKKEIGPRCVYCENEATEVFVDRMFADILRIEVIPVCDACLKVVGK